MRVSRVQLATFSHFERDQKPTMSATDKIAREILAGQSGDYDLANYDTAQVDTLVSEVRMFLQ